VETEEERGEIETEDSEDVIARIVTLAVGGLFSLILLCVCVCVCVRCYNHTNININTRKNTKSST
jgi:hypothetical protein